MRRALGRISDAMKSNELTICHDCWFPVRRSDFLLWAGFGYQSRIAGNELPRSIESV